MISSSQSQVMLPKVVLDQLSYGVAAGLKDLEARVAVSYRENVSEHKIFVEAGTSSQKSTCRFMKMAQDPIFVSQEGFAHKQRSLPSLTKAYAQKKMTELMTSWSCEQEGYRGLLLLVFQSTWRKKCFCFCVHLATIYIAISGTVLASTNLGGITTKIFGPNTMFRHEERRTRARNYEKRRTTATHNIAAAQDVITGVLILEDIERVIVDEAPTKPEYSIQLDSFEMLKLLGADTFGQM